MVNRIKLYPLGFIFSDEQLMNTPDYYQQKSVLNKFIYSYDGDSPHILLEEDDKFILIHGHHVHIDLNNDAITGDLASSLMSNFYNNREEFFGMLDHIAGRYVIVIGDIDEIYIFPDAINSRSTYFTEERRIISSHVELINDNFNFSKDLINDAVPALNITFQKTNFKKIKSLVPNYYIDLKKKEFIRFFPREDYIYNKMNTEEKMGLIIKFWERQLDYYIAKYNKIFLSFSGGLDS